VFKKLRDVIEETAKRNEENMIPYEERVQNEVLAFRVFCQGTCIEQISNEFISNYDMIMEGQYKRDALLECAATKELTEIVRENCVEYAYGNNEVLSLELIAKSALTSLLDRFVIAASDDENFEKTRHANGKLYKLISKNFKHVQYLDENSKFSRNKVLSKHERVQMVVDDISCMTDSFALNLHKTLLGMRLP
jgi:dGTPase